MPQAPTAGPGASLAAGADTDPDLDEAAVIAIVRKVLDEELRDRVNTVVDARIQSETERRHWRRDQGAF